MELQSLLLIQGSLNKLLTEYADVFNPGLGHCKDINAKLYLEDGAVPKFNQPRPPQH